MIEAEKELVREGRKEEIESTKNESLVPTDLEPNQKKLLKRLLK